MKYSQKTSSIEQICLFTYLGAVFFILKAGKFSLIFATTPLLIALWVGVNKRHQLEKSIYDAKSHQRQIYQSLENRQLKADSLISELEHKISMVNEKIASSQDEFNQLISRTDLKLELSRAKKSLQQDFDISLAQQIKEINSLVKNDDPHSQLIIGRERSREILIEALKRAEKRVILVCPWLTEYGFDEEIENLCKKFLDRGGVLEIGWGKLDQLNFKRKKLVRLGDIEGFLETFLDKQWLYAELKTLYQMSLTYPGLCNLKMMGTHEKYLVCDRHFAMVGSHNFLSSGSSGDDLEMGIKTNDQNIIEKLIKAYESASDLTTTSRLPILKERDKAA